MDRVAGALLAEDVGAEFHAQALEQIHEGARLIILAPVERQVFAKMRGAAWVVLFVKHAGFDEQAAGRAPWAPRGGGSQSGGRWKACRNGRRVGLEIGGLVGEGNRGGASEARETEPGGGDYQSEERGEAFHGGRGGGPRDRFAFRSVGLASVWSPRWASSVSAFPRSAVAASRAWGGGFGENETDEPRAHTVGHIPWANGPRKGRQHVKVGVTGPAAT